METVAIIGVIALYLGPWLLTPIPAILACRKDGLEATGQPLMLSAVAFPLAFIVVSILYSMLTAATAHGTFAVAATFSIVTHIIAGIVYLHPPQRIHPDIVPPRERLTGPADPPTRRLCRRPRPNLHTGPNHRPSRSPRLWTTWPESTAPRPITTAPFATIRCQSSFRGEPFTGTFRGLKAASR